MVSLSLFFELRSGFPVTFFTAVGLVHRLRQNGRRDARGERRLLKLQARLAAVKLLIVDELGYVPLLSEAHQMPLDRAESRRRTRTGAELLFEIFSQRHERRSTIVTSNLPFEEGTHRLRQPASRWRVLDRLTHHVHILESNGESYRLKQSKAR